MKKNFAMRIAACLLVVTMLSLCMVSYTYAKYTTADKKDDIAQVAKWGVKVTVDLADLFETGYDDAEVAETDATKATVLTSGTANMLAPGTNDTTAAALVISGKPEVAVSITYTVDVVLDKWATDLANPTTSEYCPLVITVDIDGTATEFKIDGSAIKTVAELEAAVEKAITDLNQARVNPNVDLAKTIKISWAWAFHVDAATDAKDTALGDNAALDNPATFKIVLGAEVTQLN